MINRIFEILFKFRPLQYMEGKLAFNAGSNGFIFITLIVLLLTGLYYIYKKSKSYTSRRTSRISFVLRAVAILLLCFPLLEPVLLVPDVIPKENFLVVLADKSESMTIKDGFWKGNRNNDVHHILFNEDEGIYKELSENYNVRTYIFGSKPEKVDSLANYLPEASETNVANALKGITNDFKDLPLAGVVLLTDGADNSLDDSYEAINELRRLQVPLHIVGLGKENIGRERELLNVATSKGLEEGAGAEIDVQARSWNEETEQVNFNIFQGDRKVFTEKKYLSGNGKIDHFTFFYEPDQKGSVEYSLQIDGVADEINTANNSLNMLIDTKKDTIRILFFEGQLRSDFKFIKRALENDPVFEFTSVSRTGKDKYFRQGIKKQEELINGFPATEEELYRFKAVIFGDIESAYFTANQINMIENFVRLRGGGFLMLGGQNLFTQGNYLNTPITDIIPLEINPYLKETFLDLSDLPGEDVGFKFIPTSQGLNHPVLKLASERNSNRAIWNEMPKLTSINFFGEAKPGATVLAIKPKDRFSDQEPLLAIQKYGRGRSAVFASSSTWRWKLLVDARNNRHERFWQQMARWLVTDAPDKVTITIAENVVEPEKALPIKVSVFDKEFNPVKFADVKATVTNPSGEQEDIVFHPELALEGEYSGQIEPKVQGIHNIKVEAMAEGKIVGSNDLSFLARKSKKEFYDATLKRDFLEDLVKTSGGIYYTPEEASDIPFNLRTKKTETTIMKTEYLWDMPILFILILVLFASEWLYRRRRGLS